MILNALSMLRRWAILYFVALVVASLLVFTLFRDASYPTGQVAVAIVLPVFLLILAWRIITYFSTAKEEKEEIQKPEKPSVWFRPLTNLFFILFILSFIFSVMMLFSSAIYPVLGLNWAVNTASKVGVLSIIMAASSFICLFIIALIFIITPYWKKIFKVFRERLSLFSEIPSDFHINGYKLRPHR